MSAAAAAAAPMAVSERVRKNGLTAKREDRRRNICLWQLGVTQTGIAMDKMMDARPALVVGSIKKKMATSEKKN